LAAAMKCMTDIPTILNELEAAGLTNANVARQLNIARSTVSKWKFGKGEYMTLKNWEKLTSLHAKIVAEVACRKPQEIGTRL
jgi:predicted transcriptional regulator